MAKMASNSQEGFIIGVEKDEAPPQGFIVGTGENKRIGFRRPMILAQNRKDKIQLVSPIDNRPKKRLRQIMDESFNFTVLVANAAPSQGVASVQEGIHNQDKTLHQMSGDFDLDIRVSSRSTSDSSVDESAAAIASGVGFGNKGGSV
ncbi:hypothetical protein Hanom_Chr15g01398471 [Helianthus anomalus]